MIKFVNVYDMDGCIVDSMHRYRTIIDSNGIERIDLQHWRDNQFRANEDSLLPLAEQYKADLMRDDTFVIIATARELNEPDNWFINSILGKPDAIISRKHGDSISGALLKIKGLQRYFNLKQFRNAIWTMHEDNISYLKAVCNHFRINGVYIPSNQGH